MNCDYQNKTFSFEGLPLCHAGSAGFNGPASNFHPQSSFRLRCRIGHNFPSRLTHRLSTLLTVVLLDTLGYCSISSIVLHFNPSVILNASKSMRTRHLLALLGQYRFTVSTSLRRSILHAILVQMPPQNPTPSPLSLTLEHTR